MNHACFIVQLNFFFYKGFGGGELSLELVSKILISEGICIFSSMQCLCKHAKIIGDHIQVFQGGSSMFEPFMFWSTESFTRRSVGSYLRKGRNYNILVS